MKAIRIHQFGGPEVLSLEDIPVPRPEKGQLLVRVRAAGVGPWDAWVRAGRSVIPQPLPLTPGSDIAGTVEVVGSGSPPFAPGDEVYGVTNTRFTDGYAEYALAAEAMMARKPRRLSFIEAASVPVIAVTAWQMLFEYAGVKSGQCVLVHGAAGNVGAYAVQFARSVGVRVIASALPSERSEVQRLGADEIVEVTSGTEQESVDAVIDTVGGPSQNALFSFLKPGGTFVSSVSPPDAALAKERRVRPVFFLVNVNRKDLETIGRLVDTTEMVVRIGEVLPLSAARQAHEMLEGLRPRPVGKIVLDVRPT